MVDGVEEVSKKAMTKRFGRTSDWITIQTVRELGLVENFERVRSRY